MALSSLQLEAFYTVAQTSSFTKAAGRLGVTQSALSQRILNLEDELETTLFIRDRGALRLTEAAESLLRYCRTKDSLELEFVSTLKSATSKKLSGVIRVAGYSSVMRSVILPALADLVSRHESLQVEFLSREMDQLLPLLKRGEADFIVSDRSYEGAELEHRDLGLEKNVLVERRGYDGPEVYLDHDERDETTLKYLKLSRPDKLPLRRRYLDDVYGLIDGVKLGYGRAVLPLHLIKADRTLTVLQPRKVLESPVRLSYFRQAHYSKLHQAVVTELTNGAPKFLNPI